MNAVYADDAANYMVGVTVVDYDSMFYILITGAPASTLVFTLLITYTFEFSSQASFHPVIP